MKAENVWERMIRDVINSFRQRLLLWKSSINHVLETNNIPYQVLLR